MSSRSKPQPLRTRLKEEARAAILDAAEQVMAEQGLTATRMEDIAARVGVSVGTLYNYFEDRRQLLQALLEQQAQQLLGQLDAELERGQGEPYRARLHGVLRIILEHTARHFRFFTFLVQEDARRPDEQRQSHQRVWSEASARLERLGAEGIAQGELRADDAAHYPTLLLGMVQSLLWRQLLEHRPLPVEEQLALLLRCFLAGASPRPT